MARANGLEGTNPTVPGKEPVVASGDGLAMGMKKGDVPEQGTRNFRVKTSVLFPPPFSTYGILSKSFHMSANYLHIDRTGITTSILM